MQTTFSVVVNADMTLSEAELADDAVLASVRPRLLGRNEFYGSIDITHGEQQFSLKDDLPPLVLSLCFAAPPKIGAAQSATIQLASGPGVIRLLPEGDLVRITRKDHPDRLFPAQELGDSLLACGQRFVTFFAALTAGEEDWQDAREALQSTAAALSPPR